MSFYTIYTKNKGTRFYLKEGDKFSSNFSDAKLFRKSEAEKIRSELNSIHMPKHTFFLQHKVRPKVSEDKLREGKKRLESFTGHRAKRLTRIKKRDNDVVLKVGNLLGIAYQAKRDGKLENYFHEFRPSSRPILCVNDDGTQLVIHGGSYLFTDTGINDT